MDYEKIIKQMIADEAISKEVAAKYFPELKESEGERIVKAIKYALDHVFTNNTTVYETTKEQCLAWLKKLGGQKPAEWSEEDERMWLSAIEYICTYPAHTNSVVDWLKSLKDRFTWKPSEEQMRVLTWCMPLFCDPNSKEILESLINDLKKLRER